MHHAGGDLRDQLAHVGCSVVTAGLVVGSGGNLSARTPGGDTCWITASGTWLDRLTPDSFAEIRLDGEGAAGHRPPSPRAAVSGPSPSSEYLLHVATYRVRPDVNAIVHLHPQTLLLLDALAEQVRLLTTDHVFYLRRVVSTPFAPPGSATVAERAAEAAADGTNCVILGRHGCSVLAPTVELAHKRALYLEEAARLTYRALALGRGVPETPSELLDWVGGATST